MIHFQVKNNHYHNNNVITLSLTNQRVKPNLSTRKLIRKNHITTNKNKKKKDSNSNHLHNIYIYMKQVNPPLS